LGPEAAKGTVLLLWLWLLCMVLLEALVGCLHERPRGLLLQLLLLLLLLLWLLWGPALLLLLLLLLLLFVEPRRVLLLGSLVRWPPSGSRSLWWDICVGVPKRPWSRLVWGGLPQMLLLLRLLLPGLLQVSCAKTVLLLRPC
jgi:hypothetical protein